MGNRIALAIVADLSDLSQLGHLRQLVMAAPDVDRQSLARLLSREHGLGIRPTIYVSLRDQALSSSWRGHSYPRAGDFSWWMTGRDPYFAFAYLPADVVDTTSVDHSILGHAAFIDTPEGAADLCGVLAGLNPAQRGLTPLDHVTNYLRLEPGHRSAGC